MFKVGNKIRMIGTPGWKGSEGVVFRAASNHSIGNGLGGYDYAIAVDGYPNSPTYLVYVWESEIIGITND